MINPKLGTNALRCLAILLVINSHMDILYPVPQLSTGGAIGNALFFMLSAYGITLSERKKSQTFSEYFGKRVTRVYIPVWTCVVFLVVPIIGWYVSQAKYEVVQATLTYFGLNKLLSAIGILFYPPPAFWFLDVLMLYYLVGFFLIKHYSRRRLLVAGAVTLLIYAVMYLGAGDYSILIIEQWIQFKTVFYFLVFLFGIDLAVSGYGMPVKHRGWVGNFLLLILSLLLFYGHKLLMMKGVLLPWQFVQQVLIFPIILALMRLFHQPGVLRWLASLPRLNHFMGLGAAMTLELYLTHGPLRGLLAPTLPPFPLSVGIYLLAVVLYSYGLYRVNGWVRRGLIEYLQRIDGKPSPQAT